MQNKFLKGVGYALIYLSGAVHMAQASVIFPVNPDYQMSPLTIVFGILMFGFGMNCINNEDD